MKRVIEFDDKDLGCKHCPYFRNKSSDDIFSENGCFCAKETPWKRISYCQDSLDGLVQTPEWCKLIEISIDKINSSINKTILQANKSVVLKPSTTRIISQFQASQSMINILSARELNDIIKQNIARGIACNDSFQDTIKFTEITDFQGSKIVRGEIEILNKENGIY